MKVELGGSIYVQVKDHSREPPPSRRHLYTQGDTGVAHLVRYYATGIRQKIPY